MPVSHRRRLPQLRPRDEALYHPFRQSIATCAPFAGMTRIRFDGYAQGSALSAPHKGLPGVDDYELYPLLRLGPGSGDEEVGEALPAHTLVWMVAIIAAAARCGCRASAPSSRRRFPWRRRWRPNRR